MDAERVHVTEAKGIGSIAQTVQLRSYPLEGSLGVFLNTVPILRSMERFLGLGDQTAGLTSRLQVQLSKGF